MIRYFFLSPDLADCNGVTGERKTFKLFGVSEKSGNLRLFTREKSESVHGLDTF